MAGKRSEHRTHDKTMIQRFDTVSFTLPLAFALSTAFVEAASYTPLNDLGVGLYLNQFQGGLYPDGSNNVPLAHAAEGVLRAAAVHPLNTLGQPDPNGKYVLVSIGMSNTTQEFCSVQSVGTCQPWSFMGQAASDPTVNHKSLFIIDGALAANRHPFGIRPPIRTMTASLRTGLLPTALANAKSRSLGSKSPILDPTSLCQMRTPTPVGSSTRWATLRVR